MGVGLQLERCSLSSGSVSTLAPLHVPNARRQLLHEEKESSRVPAVLENSANLSRDELIERTEAALAAYGRERRRNAELVHRLQQMHAEQVDVLELKKR